MTGAALSAEAIAYAGLKRLASELTGPRPGGTPASRLGREARVSKPAKP